MSETAMQLGFNRASESHFFMCSGVVWVANMYWCPSSCKPDSFVSDYSGDVYFSALKREMEELGKLTIAAVRLTPSRFKRITELEKPCVLREDMKGGERDPKPWFFRKAIPPLMFTSTFYHWEGGGQWQTTFSEVSSNRTMTPSQRDWIKCHVIPYLDRCFTFDDRIAFLQEVKRVAASKWKDGLIEKAFNRMAHFRSLAECIESHYDELMP